MPKQRKRFGPLKKITKSNINKLPDKPGVYGIFKDSGEILKVGRAKRFRVGERIKESTDEINKEKRTPQKFGFIPTKTVEDAKKLETQLIIKRKPPFNKEKKGK